MANLSGDNNDAGMIGGFIDNNRPSFTQILVVLIALLLNMLDGFDVTAMAFTAHSIGEQLAIQPDKLGIVFSVALAGMMIGAMFLAPLSDVFGRRNMILICVFTVGVSMILTAHATSLLQLIILRLITGLGVGSLLASLAAISSEYMPQKYRSLAVVSITAGYPLGASFGGFIAAPIIAQYGWQSVFQLGGYITLAMVAAVYFLVPESLQFLAIKKPAKALEKFNRILRRLGHKAIDALPEVPTQHEQRANVFGLLSKERREKTVMLWLTFFFCFIGLYFLISWIPKLVVDAGLSESDGVYASACFNGGAVIGVLLLGWLASRMSLSNLIGIFLATSAVVMLAFALFDGLNHLLGYLLVIGILLQGGFTGLYAVAAKLYPTELRSTGVGWAIGLGRFGAVLGPLAGGMLIAANVSMEHNFIIYAVPLILAGLLAFRLKVR